MRITYTNYGIWRLPILQDGGVLVTREVIFSCRDEPRLRAYVICRKLSEDGVPQVMGISVFGDDSNSKYVCGRSVPISDEERQFVIDAFHAGPKAGIDMTDESAPHTTDYDMEVA